MFESRVASRFLELLWGDRKGYAEVRVIREGRPVSQSFTEWPSHAEKVTEAIAHDIDSNIFMGVLLRRSAIGDAAHCEDETEWLWADIDEKRGVTFARLLRSISLVPQIVVDSGHGWHLYWHLDEPVPTHVAQGAMKVIATALGGDAVGDPARIMRIPGTVNHKDGGSVPVRLLRLDPLTKHRFSDFDLPLPDVPRGERTLYDGEEWTLSSTDSPKFPDGERNRGLTRLAGAMVLKGMAHESILDALLAENVIRCDPPLNDKEVMNVARSVARYSRSVP